LIKYFISLILSMTIESIESIKSYILAQSAAQEANISLILVTPFFVLVNLTPSQIKIH
jgi:hypothetical protein